jgi:hypothetical protein
MIELSTQAQSVLGRSHTRHVRVQSWLDGELLADDVPVDAGHEEADRSLRVPERITLTVPRLDRGMSWSPVEADHPLAANGQLLRVEVGIGVAAGQVEWIQRGWFVVRETPTGGGDSVEVEAVGLLHLIDEARLVSPYQPSGTLADTVRGLVEPALTVDIDAALTDRAVPSGINYDEDRLGALLELLDAWPADAHVTADGVLAVAPADTSTVADLALTDGAGGTVIRAPGTSTREGAFNAVVARGTASDGTQVQGVAFDTATNSPKRYGGPFNPLPVPHFFSSPLLTTTAQCQAAAATVRERIRRTTALEFSVEMVPHPGLQPGDVVELTTDDHTALPCSVEALRLPYNADGGAATLRVRILT